jgi:murein DD-endopeptidase MepM/ murein hydrolase activator NlpD
MDREQRLMIKLAVSLAILIIAVAIKFMFPDIVSKINGSLPADMDYRSALGALGEGLSGSKNMSEALGEAYTYAFVGIPEEDEKEPPKEVEENKSGGEDTENKSEMAEPEDGGTVQMSNDAEDEIARKVGAFIDRQSAYADMDMPGDVTYDYVDLGIECALPTDGTVTSPFGFRSHPTDQEVRFHYGTDIGAADGTEIRSFAAGRIYAIGESSTLGLYVIVEHANGITTEYGHLSEVFVESGQEVAKGERIAAMGSSGNATGVCLHFSVKSGGTYINPEYYVSWS